MLTIFLIFSLISKLLSGQYHPPKVPLITQTFKLKEVIMQQYADYLDNAATGKVILGKFGKVA
jgi:hypothetical protein